MFAVNIGILLHVVDCCKIVAHVLAGIVTRNLGIPLGAETGKAAAVGGDDDIAVRGHEGKVPACAPELADSLLRTTLAVEKRGIFLVGVKLRRIHHPYEHFLTIGGGHHLLLYGGHLERAEQLGVDIGELFYLAVDHTAYLVGIGHGVTAGEYSAVAGYVETRVVTYAVGDFAHLV